MKFPTIPEGLKAAHEFVGKGGRVNMTLVFDQDQAAAVYSATVATKQPAFVSPFIGRWDDRGYDGIDLVKNIIKMYKKFDNTRHAKKPHVEVLAASIRSMEHFYASIFLGADILTVPMKIIEQWIHEEKWMPDEHYRIESKGLKSLIYKDLHFESDYTKYSLAQHEGDLLDEGVKKFVADWKSLIG
jgi:transaldolase